MWRKNHTCPTRLSHETERDIRECAILHEEMAALLDKTDGEGYVIDYVYTDIEDIARTYRRFNRLQRGLEKRGFEQYMPYYAGTCWNDMAIWADEIESLKEDFGYEDSEPECGEGSEPDCDEAGESEKESTDENPKRRKLDKFD